MLFIYYSISKMWKNDPAEALGVCGEKCGGTCPVCFPEGEMVLVYNIVWDTDGDEPDEVLADLPDEVEVPIIHHIDECIDDYLSDEYGFCVKSFAVATWGC